MATINGFDGVNDTLDGTEDPDTINGLSGNDIITAKGGADTIDGGAGADTMNGGAGNDTYYVDDLGDRVVETDYNHGIDTVYSSVSYDAWTIGRNVSIVRLTGTADINASGVGTIYGNDGDNRLSGNKLYGGEGDDTYVVVSSEDSEDTDVFEAAGEGNDTIYSAYSYTIAAGQEVENLYLSGAARRGTGNEIANTIHASSNGSSLYGKGGNDALFGGVEDDNLYGEADSDTLSGGDGTDKLDGGVGADIMAGGDGNDSYYVDETGDIVNEEPGGGTDRVFASIGYTLATELEHLALTGTADINGTGNKYANTLTGNSGANTLSGLKGNDTIDGGDGADTLYGAEGVDILTGGLGIDIMYGGTEDDIYYVDNSSDLALEVKNEGHDLVYASVTYALGSTSYIDDLTLQGSGDINGTGNNISNVINGNSGANTLYGLKGDDKLDGKGGTDQLYGGLGDDSYYVDKADDFAFEAKGEGTDIVYASRNYSLSNTSYVENLTFKSTGNFVGTGNNIANVLTGNSGDNTFYGLKGDDKLDGKAGADQLYGGVGNDTYYVDNAEDFAYEVKNEGTDTVIASLTYSLSNTSYVDNLTLTGGLNIDGTGNNIANLLTGNSGANSLYGLKGNDVLDGKAGADQLYGGEGDDTYYADNAEDFAYETKNQGNDTIFASVDYSLSNTSYVDNLTLTGLANIGTGNNIANILTGGDDGDKLFGLKGNDVLDGKANVDRLYGGEGNDTYYVDDLEDLVFEIRGEGTDTVIASHGYYLNNDSYVDNLTLTGAENTAAGGNNIANVLIGNLGNNELIGAKGNDTLDGGQGDDNLSGGIGADIFLFKLESGVDTIVDFHASEGDTIDVSAHGAGASAIISQHGADTWIELGGGNVVIVLNTTATDAAFLANIVW